MKQLLRHCTAFFFAPVAATGFGLMRIAWGCVTFVYFLMQWADATTFYSASGILPPEIAASMVRGAWRFSILDIVTDPTAVFGLYLLLLVTSVTMAVGVWPRVSTVLSVLLVFSFHERNPFILGGGDTLLRHTGFLLLLAPELRACSLQRWKLQWHHWRRSRTLLPALTMPIWPYRLLLWQMIVLYSSSLWFKHLGTMWENGTAVAAVFHHPAFSHMSKAMADRLSGVGTTITFATMLFHTGWPLLLIPRALTNRLPAWFPRLPLKRTLLLMGVLFHGGIFLFMDAGSFSLSIFTAYLGLLLQEDVDAIRDALNFRQKHDQPKRSSSNQQPANQQRKISSNIAVLYDGHCGFCRRSVFVLTMLDSLHRLQLVDYWNTTEKNRVAKDLHIADLDRAMHIRMPHGKTLKGFDAIRRVSWHLPVLWLIAPVLYIPGVPPIGRRVYREIAERRKKCGHDRC